MKFALRTVGVAVILAGGAFIGVQEKAEQPLAPLIQEDTSHPECYDTAKMNDPNDYCYQTIGPWNSRLLTDDEVRSVASLEQMIAAGYPVDVIQSFYPEHQH